MQALGDLMFHVVINGVSYKKEGDYVFIRCGGTRRVRMPWADLISFVRQARRDKIGAEPDKPKDTHVT